MKVEPTLETLDFRLIRNVLADAVPSILAEGFHKFFELLVLQVSSIVSTYLLSRPNDAAGGSLVLAIAFSLFWQNLTGLVDARHTILISLLTCEIRSGLELRELFVCLLLTGGFIVFGGVG